MRPSSLKASLMSRTRSRSRALFATLRSFSRSAFTSTGRSSSSSSKSTSSPLARRSAGEGGGWGGEGNIAVCTVGQGQATLVGVKFEGNLRLFCFVFQSGTFFLIPARLTGWLWSVRWIAFYVLVVKGSRSTSPIKVLKVPDFILYSILTYIHHDCGVSLHWQMFLF